MARPAAFLVGLAALAFTACGGGGQETTPASQPAISAGTAQALADQADGIADTLESGDVCGAAHEADAFDQAVIDAINGGRVPAAFQESLLATAHKLRDTINCPQTEEDENKDEEKGKGKKKGHDEETTTVPDTTTGATTGATTTVGG